MALHPIGIKHGNQPTFLHSLVIAQNIEQFSSGAVDGMFRQFLKLIPCKNNIVAVNQKILFPGGFLFVGSHHGNTVRFLPVFPTGLSPRGIPPPVGVKGAFQDGIHFLRANPRFFPFRSIAPCACPLTFSVGSSGRPGYSIYPVFLCFQTALQMHILRDLVPVHQESCPMGTEYGA